MTMRTKAPVWTLGDRLRKAREFAGLSQKEIADEFGVGRNAIIRYENDQTVPRKLVVEAWARRCGVPLEWILGLPHLDSNQEPAGYSHLRLAA